MSTPHFIASDEELNRLHLLGHGFVYNDYSGNVPSGLLGNVLHFAGCRHIGRSNTKYRKVFFSHADDATRWISGQRGPEGIRWRRCACCRSEHAGSNDASGTTLARSIPSATETAPAKPQQKPRPDRPHETTPFTEGRVEDVLQPWLEAAGYSVDKRVRVGNGVIDMVARRQGDEWVIEAKGEDRGGFGTAEMNFRIGIAQICSRMDGTLERRYALALPLTTHFRRLLLKHRDFTVFERMEIWMLIISPDGIVTALSPNSVQRFVDALATS